MSTWGTPSGRGRGCEALSARQNIRNEQKIAAYATMCSWRWSANQIYCQKNSYSNVDQHRHASCIMKIANVCHVLHALCNYEDVPWSTSDSYLLALERCIQDLIHMIREHRERAIRSSPTWHMSAGERCGPKHLHLHLGPAVNHELGYRQGNLQSSTTSNIL